MSRWDKMAPMALYAVTIRITATPEQAEPAVLGQIAAFDEMGQAGRIRLAGRLEREDGFLAIFEAKDLLDARGTAEGFPLIEAGLASWSLRLFEELPT